MILYYNINNPSDLNALIDKNPWFALSILSVSIILWFILLIRYFKKWILSVFVSKRNVDYLKNHGLRREAKILNATKLSKDNAKYDTYELNLSFKNLVDTEITQIAGVNDAKPHERRFAVGHRVDLLIDQEMKRVPYFIFASTEASINKTTLFLRLLGWLALCAIVAAYYAYSYHIESYGYGWRFLSLVHPLILCPAILLLYSFVLALIFKKIRGIDQAAVIKFKGIKTTAKLIEANQTGTYINEQPMIRFELEYTDDKHQVHRSSLKKVVDLLHLDITKQPYIDIFYLKEDPKVIAFASDLNETS
ncbi:hypothetical protein [Pedobacter nototheniae]|uniref:hypothetical protein n=1 Tax=Pedobacter nototheniae TaxID=2488994 RepID=UPI00292F7F9C|nr:hypothetical protein [Pedobacter nototheniae]